MFRQPVHVISLVAMGMPLLDNANLEELAAACERKVSYIQHCHELSDSQGRWSFLLSITPLALEGTTGSPVNPVAVF